MFQETLNGMGYQALSSDPYSQDFVKHAIQSGQPCMDVGCAFGLTAKQALSRALRWRVVILMRATLRRSKKPCEKSTYLDVRTRFSPFSIRINDVYSLNDEPVELGKHEQTSF